MTIFNTTKGPVEIRELHSIADMISAETIQLEVWGMQTYPTPKELLIPVQHEGGYLVGAFSSEGKMVGMVFGFPTSQPGLLHSHIAATLKEWRNLGIGAQMKWFQRDWCLEHGFSRVRWTVDPLRATNAELNIRKLGGYASTYYTDYYGATYGIDAGSPTDRLLLEWDLTSPRVVQRIQTTPPDVGFPSAVPVNEISNNEPVNPRLDLEDKQLLLRLPDDFVKLSAQDVQLASRWRMQTRQLFEHYFARGYTIVEFTRVDGPAYLLEKRPN
jgi:chorismate synthase